MGMRVNSLVVGAAHVAPIFLDREATIQRATDLVEEAADRKVDFLVFPESFVSGFPYWINITPPLHQRGLYRRLWESALEAGDLTPLDGLRRMCKRARMTVVLGANQRRGGSIYNVQLVLDGPRNGVSIRRKFVPTFAERTVWAYGDGSDLRTFDTSVGRVSALMCWEHTMHLVRQVLLEDRPQLHAAAWPALKTVSGLEQSEAKVDLLIRHHAFTNQSFVVSAMSPITPGIVEAVSHLPGAPDMIAPGPAWSAVVGPDGAVIAEHRGEKDYLLVTEVDLARTVDEAHLLDLAGHYSRPEILSVQIDRRAFGVVTGPGNSD